MSKVEERNRNSGPCIGHLESNKRDALNVMAAQHCRCVQQLGRKIFSPAD